MCRTAMALSGASRGIGRAIALGYAASGAEVIAIARSKDALDDVVHETLYAEFRERADAPVPMLEHLVQAGFLGRKSARGFYTY